MDTIVIGIDGAEWDVLDRLIEDGDLPNLAALKSDGASGSLHSITPPVSPPAWASIQTGTNPGKHGIYDFSFFDEQYRRRSTNATDRQATPFWEVLNDNGVSTGLFKVPFTYPPQPVDGFMVSGFPTPDNATDFAHPSSIMDRIGDPTRLFEDWSLQHRGEMAAFRDDLLEVVDIQTEVLLELLEDYDVDFLMTVYDGADRIQHFFWQYFDEDHPLHEPDSPLVGAIPAFYRAVDDAIGELLEAVDGDPDVVVISDHGFGPLEKDIYLNDWLEANGYLKRVDEDAARSRLLDLGGTILDQSWSVLQRAGIDQRVKAALPEDVFFAGRTVKEGRQTKIDWEQTEAYFMTLSGQSLLVNREDEFADGIISDDAYDDFAAELQSSLETIEDPETQEPVVEAVHRADELFDGWAMDRAPDFVVETKPEYTLQTGTGDSLVEMASQHSQIRTGDHRPEGVFIANGPSFGQTEVSGASVMDIAPTLLSLASTAIPTSMDGAVLESALSAESRREVEPTYTDKYGRDVRNRREWSDAEAAELEERLQRMGYIE